MRRNWLELTWEEVKALDLDRAVAILPVGAIEAHGPHLPLSTDVLIAEAMAQAAAERLEGRGLAVLVLPTVNYSVAGFASGFPGTVSVRPEAATALIVDVARSLAGVGIRKLGIANAHLDPGHLASIYGAVDQIREEKSVEAVFPDITRKPWALRLTDEFKSGACHAGRFEGSLIMALRPDLVREEIQAGLPPNPASLSRAIREGKASFEEAGGARAYFGWPADASAEEGERILETLARILEEALTSPR